MAGLFDAETETLARAFAASSAAFLERLRWMTAALGPPYEFSHSFERGREIKWNTIFLHDFIKPINGPEWQTTGVSWAPPEIDFMAFNTHAWQTREGWLVAKEFNAELSKFDCSTLKKLSSVMLKPDFRGGLACFLETCASQINKLNELGDDASEIDRLEAELNVLQYVLLIRVVLEFHQAVERFELVLSMTAAAAVPVAPGAEFVDSDYAELISKSDLAFLFGVDRATISRRIQSGELRTLPGTSDTAKKVRVHGDDFPAGLKRLNERKQKLSTMPKRAKRQ